MNKVVDLTGKQYGSLYVLGRVDNDKYGGTRYLCLCDCGNRIEVASKHLRSGATKSCGCKRTELIRQKNLIDMQGQIINDWLVLEEDKEVQRSAHETQAYWLCKCAICFDNQQTFSGTSLRDGSAPRCTCSNYVEDWNTIWQIPETTREFGIGYATCTTCGQDQLVYVPYADDGKVPCFHCNSIDYLRVRWEGTLLGNIYNGVKVMSYAGSRNGVRRWNCKCEQCAREFEVSQSQLRKEVGHTLCTSCRKRAAAGVGIGDRRGYLTVLGYTTKNGRTSLDCECICGNRVTVFTSNFGRTLSCGCANSTVDSHKIEIDQTAICLYVIDAEQQYVKVGVSVDVNDRMKSLQAASPLTLRFLQVVHAGLDVETELKHLLREYRKHGEWYHQNEVVLSIIQNHLKDYEVAYINIAD